MAEKRMFAKSIIYSDKFLDMPIPAQLLYFHLAMQADDDGFVNSPKRIIRTIGVSEEDLQALIDNDYVIKFQTGVIVISHWKVHNTLRNDRRHETICQAEKALIEETNDKIYILKG